MAVLPHPGLKRRRVSADTSIRLRMSAFADQSHLPCPDCGASLADAERSDHVCDPERRADFLMFQLREEIAGFERGVREYLLSPHGRFAQWLAERRRPPLEGL
jgi:hypothetical protein